MKHANIDDAVDLLTDLLAPGGDYETAVTRLRNLLDREYTRGWATGLAIGTMAAAISMALTVWLLMPAPRAGGKMVPECPADITTLAPGVACYDTAEGVVRFRDGAQRP